MSTPPTTPTRPATTTTTTTTTTKRKRDTAKTILDDMDSRGYKPISPDTDQFWEKCRAKARRVLDHPEGDAGDFEDYWKMASKLVDSKEATKAHQAAEKSLTAKLETTKAQFDNFQHMLRIGDWASGVQNILKGAEDEVIHQFKEQLKRDLKKNSGYSGEEAKAEAELYSDFKSVQGLQANGILERLQPELDEIRKWRTEGRKIGDEPSTPNLDRVEAICQYVGITRVFFLSLLRTYNERNCMAHDPPPFDECIGDDKKMDWEKVREACERHRRTARDHYKKGDISKAQLDYFIEIIDTWLRIQVSFPSDGEPVPTVPGQQQVAKARKIINKKASKLAAKVPDSPWTEGKWDDIE